MTDSKTSFTNYLHRALSGQPLSQSNAGNAFNLMLSGELDPILVSAFLTALLLRGETVDEIAGGVEALRQHMVAVEAPAGAIDTCGTGGGKVGFCNVSTLTALTLAACGVVVAKHGNRASSSACGSADFLAAYEIPIELSPAAINACMRMCGVGFMFAPHHHPAIRHVMPIRRALGVRTIFNLLGPLCNPASVQRQLIGVPDARWLEPIAQVLNRLGTIKAWIVHGTDGMDELTLSGTSKIIEIDRGVIRSLTVIPEDIGLKRQIITPPAKARKQFDRHAVDAFLDGKPGAYRDIIILNSAAALVVAEDGTDLISNSRRAAAAIDAGHVRQTLDQLRIAANSQISAD